MWSFFLQIPIDPNYMVSPEWEIESNAVFVENQVPGVRLTLRTALSKVTSSIATKNSSWLENLVTPDVADDQQAFIDFLQSCHRIRPPSGGMLRLQQQLVKPLGIVQLLHQFLLHIILHQSKKPGPTSVQSHQLSTFPSFKHSNSAPWMPAILCSNNYFACFGLQQNTLTNLTSRCTTLFGTPVWMVCLTMWKYFTTNMQISWHSSLSVGDNLSIPWLLLCDRKEAQNPKLDRDHWPSLIRMPK